MMKWFSTSLLFARIRGTEIRFHISALLSLPVAYYLFRPVDLREWVVVFLWVFGFLAGILFHELGHALAARYFGIEVKSVVIWLLGGFTNLSRKAEKPSHTLVISAAGPLVNMLLAFINVMLYILSYFFLLPSIRDVETFLWVQSLDRVLLLLALFNLIVVVFNLLPVYPLDGGSILHALMETFFGRSNADLITLIIGVPVLLGMAAFGFYTGDYILVVFCILIALALSTLNRSLLRRINLMVNYFFRRGGYYYLQGDYENAARIFTREIDREPTQPNHYLARAACLLNTLQYERAKADVDRALNLVPEHIAALQLRGEMYMMDKDYDRAMEYFNRALSLDPNWGIPYFDRGSLLMEKSEYHAALIEFNKAISLSPQHFLFYLIRSIAHFKLGDKNSAHKDEDAALQFSEQDALMMTDLNLPVYDDNLDWAEDYYARALQKHPDFGPAYHGRADAYRLNGMHEKAVEDYTRAIQHMPKEAPSYLGRGRSYLALNQIAQAESDFEAARALTDKIHLKRQSEDLLNDLRRSS